MSGKHTRKCKALTGEVVDKLEKENLLNQLRFVLGLGLVVFPVVESSGKFPVNFAENYDGDSVDKTRNNNFPIAERI